MAGIRWLLCLLLLSGRLHAQFLYDSARDSKSQEALKTAREVTNGQVFDKMLENLDRLSKASGERFFNDAERQMRANLASFRTWGDIARFATGLDQRLMADLPGAATQSEIAAAATDVETQTNKAKGALRTLEDAAKTKFKTPDQVALIGTWFARLGQLSELIDFANQFKAVQDAPAGFVDAAKEAASLAASLGKMYGDFQVALAATPDMVVLETQVQLLEANEDHLKQLAVIIARRESDLQDTRSLLRRVSAQVKFLEGAGVRLDQPIVDSVRDRLSTPSADPKVLGAMVFVLYNAAALAARDTTPKRLASLRLAEEERRYSIRSSAVAARSYETLVASGVERLANYYKGGLKPETLAQIVNAVATLGLIPTIAVK